MLSLRRKKDHGRPVRGPFIFDHVSFGVETEEELWELKDKLKAAGFEVSDVIDHGFIHSIYSFDPNGIPIEFSVNVSARALQRHLRSIKNEQQRARDKKLKIVEIVKNDANLRDTARVE